MLELLQFTRSTRLDFMATCRLCWTCGLNTDQTTRVLQAHGF